jgi:hypothetical protein
MLTIIKLVDDDSAREIEPITRQKEKLNNVKDDEPFGPGSNVRKTIAMGEISLCVECKT